MRLKEIRKQRNFNQKVIADYLNCSQAVYSRYESGEREPALDVLIRLADFYGVTLDELVGRTPMQIEIIHDNAPPLQGDQLEMVFEPDNAPKSEDDLEQRLRAIIAEEFKKRGL